VAADVCNVQTNVIMAPEICVLEIKGLKSVDGNPLIARVHRRI
jgi:hypothetical protein